jgi:hypothetical protein
MNGLVLVALCCVAEESQAVWFQFMVCPRRRLLGGMASACVPELKPDFTVVVEGGHGFFTPPGPLFNAPKRSCSSCKRS